MSRAAFWLLAAISWLRWGKLQERNVDILDGWCVLEYEVYSPRLQSVVGYWAHGSWCPDYPYHGQCAFWV